MPTTERQEEELAKAGLGLPHVLIALLKGVVYRDEAASVWQALIDMQTQARDHFAAIGMDLAMDESEGYAFLRQRTAAEGEAELPRLIPRRPLPYPLSLLLVLLRRKLIELDTAAGESRLILSREQILEMVRVFLTGSSNEARLDDKVETQINKAVELGFLRKLRGSQDQYEVRRILVAFVDAQWLEDFGRRLETYRTHAMGDEGGAA